MKERRKFATETFIAALTCLRANGRNYFKSPRLMSRLGSTVARMMVWPAVAYAAFLGLAPGALIWMMKSGAVDLHQLAGEIATQPTQLFELLQRLDLNALWLAGAVVLLVIVKDVLLASGLPPTSTSHGKEGHS